MNSERKELLAGAVAFFVAVMVFYMIGSAPVRRANTGTYLLSARFNQTEGLVVGGKVRIAGVDTGRIVSQRLDDYYGVVVTFSLPQHILLPDDSSAAVQSESLLGGKYIELTPGGSEDMLEAGATMEITQDSPNLMKLLDKVTALSKSAKQKNKCAKK